MSAVYTSIAENANSLFLNLSPLADIRFKLHTCKYFLHSLKGCLGTSEELPTIQYLRLLFLSREARKVAMVKG